MTAISPCDRLNYTRLLRRLRQKDLAQQAGMTQQVVSAILKGRRKLTLDSVVRLARALNVSLDYILENHE